MGACLTSLVACCACNTASCCAGAVCKCCGKSVPLGTGMKTRLMYVAMFVIAILSCFVFTQVGPNAAEWIHKIPKFIYDSSKICSGEGADECFGALAIYRISAGIALFHGLQALIMLGVKDRADCRSSLQNGFWLFKFAGLAALCVVMFFVPMGFFVYYGWSALLAGVMFLFFQLVLLVDFAHSWSESWLLKYDEKEENKVWIQLLVTCTILLYIASLVMIITMYVLFARPEGCSLVTVFITITLMSGIFISCLAVHPKVQEKSPQSGLLQPAVVFFYMCFLTWSAIMSIPTDGSSDLTNCTGNPFALIQRTMGTDAMNSTHTVFGGTSQKFSIFLGAFLVLVAVSYSALRTSSQHNNLLGGPTEESRLMEGSNNSSSIAEVAEAAEAPVTAEVDEAGVPNAPASKNDDQGPVAYNYSFFHFIFMLASMYMCMLMTNWAVVHNSVGGVAALNIDQSMASVWVKIVSSWLVAVLFSWSLVAPIFMPDRNF